MYLQSTYTWTQHALVAGGLDKQQNSFQSRKKKQVKNLFSLSFLYVLSGCVEFETGLARRSLSGRA